MPERVQIEATYRAVAEHPRRCWNCRRSRYGGLGGGSMYCLTDDDEQIPVDGYRGVCDLWEKYDEA